MSTTNRQVANLPPEEPDAGNLHVRVCEGASGQPLALLGGDISWSAREAGVNAGESPVGGIRLFTTEDRANCVAARRGGEQAWGRTVRSQ